MSFLPPLRSSVLASVLAVAGILLTTTSCSRITPIGPGPTPAVAHGQRQAGPPLQVLPHLESPIVLQIMRTENATPAGGCPVDSVAVSLPPHAAPEGCFRPVGRPLTLTSAGVSKVVRLPSAGPIQYGIMLAPLGSDVAAVTALIKQAYDSRDALGVSAAGKLWDAPKVLQPFSGQQLEIALVSKSQALQLYRKLVPSS